MNRPIVDHSIHIYTIILNLESACINAKEEYIVPFKDCTPSLKDHPVAPRQGSWGANVHPQTPYHKSQNHSMHFGILD